MQTEDWIGLGFDATANRTGSKGRFGGFEAPDTPQNLEKLPLSIPPSLLEAPHCLKPWSLRYEVSIWKRDWVNRQGSGFYRRMIFSVSFLPFPIKNKRNNKRQEKPRRTIFGVPG